MDDASPEVQEKRDPLLLLAISGGPEADWKAMGAKVCDLHIHSLSN